MIQVDESKLDRTDRLGLVWCRLNSREWDPLLGQQTEKSDVTAMMAAIESIIGWANCSRCWWIYILGKTEAEWFHWFVIERFTELKQSS